MQKVIKGDNVLVLLGKDRGKTGAVERVDNKKNEVLVTGVNLYKRSLRASALKRQDGKGEIIQIAKPLNLSNVALVCPHCKKQTRIRFKVDNGEKKRICAKCKQVI